MSATNLGAGPTFIAQAPSNIAFAKYWGKQAGATQKPTNSSLSMTLSHCFTETSARSSDASDHEVFFAGQPIARSSRFGAKVYDHLDRLTKILNTRQKLCITTRNSFPQGCGIASSASGIAALTIAAIAALQEADTFDSLSQKGFSREKLADLARLGSGSSCRSMWGGYVAWDAADQSVTQLFSATHWDLSDVVVLVDVAEKACLSSEGHKRAPTSPFFAWRLAQSRERFIDVRTAIEHRDMRALGQQIEAEALSMHAVMQTSEPPAVYFNETSVAVIAAVAALRAEQHLQAFVTLDAGANVHVICPAEEARTVAQHISDRLSSVEIMMDSVGKGPNLRMELM